MYVNNGGDGTVMVRAATLQVSIDRTKDAVMENNRIVSLRRVEIAKLIKAVVDRVAVEEKL